MRKLARKALSEKLCYALIAVSALLLFAFAAEVKAETIQEIYTYYRSVDKEEGFQKLQAFLSSKDRFGKGELDSIAEITNDFLRSSKQDVELQSLIESLTYKPGIDRSRISQMFGNKEIKPQVDAILELIFTPKTLESSSRSLVITLQQHQELTFRLLNYKGRPLGWKGFELRCDLDPENKVSFSIHDSSLTIIGTGEGQTQLKPYVLISGGRVDENIYVKVTFSPVVDTTTPYLILRFWPASGQVGDTVRILSSRDGRKVNKIAFNEQKATFSCNGDTVLAVVPKDLPVNAEVSISAIWEGKTMAAATTRFTVLSKIKKPSKRLVLIGGGLTAIGLVVTVLTHTDMKSKQDDFEAEPLNRALWDNYSKAYDKRNVVAIGTGVVAAATAYLYFFKYKPSLDKYNQEQEKRRKEHGSIVITPYFANGVGVNVRIPLN